MSITLRVVQFDDPMDIRSDIIFQEFVTLERDKEVSLGRSRQCTIRIPDDFASGVHCLIRYDGTYITVEDQGSKNSTTINGLEINQGSLFVKDVISIGETFIHIDEQKSELESLNALKRDEDHMLIDIPQNLKDLTNPMISQSPRSKENIRFKKIKK